MLSSPSGARGRDLEAAKRLEGGRFQAAKGSLVEGNCESREPIRCRLCRSDHDRDVPKHANGGRLAVPWDAGGRYQSRAFNRLAIRSAARKVQAAGGAQATRAHEVEPVSSAFRGYRQRSENTATPQ